LGGSGAGRSGWRTDAGELAPGGVGVLDALVNVVCARRVAGGREAERVGGLDPAVCVGCDVGGAVEARRRGPHVGRVHAEGVGGDCVAVEVG